MFSSEKILYSNLKAPFYLAAVVILCLVAAPELTAQSPSLVDTLSLGDDIVGLPNETVILPVNLANHSDSIGGFLLLISYNPNAFRTNSSMIAKTSRLYRGADSITVSASVDTVAGTIRLLSYSQASPPVRIAIGTGAILNIGFTIKSDVPGGFYPILFAGQDASGINTLSNWSGGVTVYPTLIDGEITVLGEPNAAPVFEPLPQSVQVDVNEEVEIEVRAVDPDGDQVTLTAEYDMAGAVFSAIGGSGTFTWTPTTQGQYKVYFIAQDRWFTTRDSVRIIVGIIANSPPVFIQVNAQSVAEGGHLEFMVKAHDPDGDFITLDMVGSLANARFDGGQGDSVVSDTFYFDPDFTQGPDTIDVVFRAQDPFNNITDMAVMVIILDAPNDILVIAENQGALPGSLSRNLVVNFRNAKPSYGLQFDLIFDPEIMDIFTVEANESRTGDMAFFEGLIDEGRYRIMFFSTGLDSIKSGIGEIVEFKLDVDNDVLPGVTTVTFDSATSVQDSTGLSKFIIFSPGTYTIDILGDANLDGMVSVGDCVAIVAHIIHWITLTPRAYDAADYNRDGDVRILDLMHITNQIMGISPTTTPPVASAGTVKLLKDGIFSGYRGEVPLWLSLECEAAAVQFTIEYEPSQVQCFGVVPGDMVDDLQFKYSDDGEKIIAVVYDFDRSVFGPATGELVMLDLELAGDGVDPNQAIRLTDFEIVSADAYALNVEVLGELPTAFTLNQNYPNPFNASTVISFNIPDASRVIVDIYDILGRQVSEIYSGYLEAGHHQVIWDGTDAAGKRVTSGVYFYRMQAENFDQAKKMLLIK